MYKIEINEININANGEFFNVWLKDTYINYIGYSFSNPVVVYFSSEPTPEENQQITDKYLSLLPSDTLVLENIKYTYSIRSLDGGAYYNDVRANLSIQFSEGNLTIEKAFYIENKLLKVKNFLISGDWATAQFEITNNVVENGVVSSEDILNGYTQQFHDDIKNYIDNYVSQNY